MSRKKLTVLVVAAVLVAMAFGAGFALLTRSRSTLAAGAPATPSASAAADTPSVPPSPIPSPSPTGIASPSRLPSPTPAPAPTGAAIQECPSRAQVVDAAMARDGAGREEMVVTVGPRCSHGWAAAIVGAPSAGTQRIVFKRGPAGFVVVVYQPAMEPCPNALATMPKDLRKTVAC
jgi:hypothetical protein